jgi:site-specific recombinase XerD
MLERHLTEHVEPRRGAFLFTSPNGAPLRYTNWRRRVWLPALERANLSAVGVYVLRHSAAARLVAAGASPKALQTILGRLRGIQPHPYGHLFDSDVDDLAGRLDEISRPHRGE